MSKPAVKRFNNYKNKYHAQWEEQFPWIAPGRVVTQFKCKWCKKELVGGIVAIKKHQSSFKHQKSAASIGEQADLCITEDIKITVLDENSSALHQQTAKRKKPRDSLKLAYLKKIGDKQSKKKVLSDHNDQENEQIEHNIDSILELLESAILVKTDDGGVYLSAKDVQTIEAFLEQQNDLIDEKTEEFTLVYEDADDNVFKDAVEEGTTSTSDELSFASTAVEIEEIEDEQDAKQFKDDEQVHDDHKCGMYTEGIQDCIRVKEDNVEGTSENITLVKVLNEIIKNKYGNEELYYIPPKTIKLIETFLEKHTLDCERELG